MNNMERLLQAREAFSVPAATGDVSARELMTHLTDKWSLWVLSSLAETGGPMRFSRILDAVTGVSQKSLTKTLRQLERDGLITRQMFMEVPPRVEYTITPLAQDLLRHVEPLWTWVSRKGRVIEGMRTSFDTRTEIVQ